MTDKKIEDFGEKIEGARKDLAAIRKGDMKLTEAVFEGWTDKERTEYITKDLVWKKPDYKKLCEDGADREALYFIKNLRDSLLIKPYDPTTRSMASPEREEKIERYQRGYINFVSEMRDRAMSLTECHGEDEIAQEIRRMLDDVTSKYLTRTSSRCYAASEEAYGCMNNKVFRALQKRYSELQRDVKNKQFCYSEDEKILADHVEEIIRPSDALDFSMKLTELCGKAVLRIHIEDEKSTRDYNIFDPHFTDGSYSLDFDSNEYLAIGRMDAKRGGITILCEGRASEQDAKEVILRMVKKREHLDKDKQSDDKSHDSDNYASKRRTKLLPPQLSEIRRYGTEHRENDQNITGEDILEAFKLRGGQFGNWTNQNDRQTSMNMLYDAFRDLAVALDISYEDIALKQSKDSRTSALAIAFGARGHSSALAHYEPVENVINLTKMRGAGSLAHEWGHALDCFIKEECKLLTLASDPKQKPMASHAQQKDNPFTPVIEAMRYHEVQYSGQDYSMRGMTEFYKESQKTDNEYAKTDNGYWQSNCEMFARCFACYVHDKLKEKGIRSDYLCGHSESTVVPHGEEREQINQAIDNMVAELKERGILHHQEHDIEAEMLKSAKPTVPKPVYDTSDYESGEQLSLFGAEIAEEAKQLDEPEPTHTYSAKLYQLKEKCNSNLFMPYSFATRNGMSPNIADYDLKYEIKDASEFVTDGKINLEKIFEKFNIDRPDDFTGHSMSTSDVLITAEDTELKCFYCDSIGFKEMPDFLLDREPPKEVFDFTKQDFLLSVHSESLYCDGKANVRMCANTIDIQDIPEELQESLLSRAGIRSESNIEKALGLDVKVCIDFDEDGTVEGILELKNGAVQVGERSFTLTDAETELLLDKAEATLNHSLAEEYMSVKNAVLLFDEEKQYGDYDDR